MMETPSSVSLLKPRLRLLRRRPNLLTPDNGKTDVVSSSASNDFASSSEEEDNQSTPVTSLGVEPGPSRISLSSLSIDPIPADTPAARLRALLTLTPRSPPTTSSIARENLDELFSRALDSDISYESLHDISPLGAWIGTPSQPTVKPVTVDTPISSPGSNSPPPRTPAPPGAWAATPNQPIVRAATIDTPVPSPCPNSLLPHTPAPPGGWMATPNQPTAQALTMNDSQFGTIGRRRSLLKVRFDISETESSVAGDDRSSLLSAIRSDNPEVPELPERGVFHSPRPLHKSPMVRVVDSYGRDADDAAASEAESSHDQIDQADMDMGTHSPSHPIVLASPTNTSDTIARMKLTLQELHQGLSDADRSADEFGFNSDHLAKLDKVSTTARLARSELAQKVQREAAKESEISMRKAPPWTKRLLQNGTNVGWNRTHVYCILFVQLLLILVMWRYAHVEARRLFYTTYYDPLYPELYSLDGSPDFVRALSPSPSWTAPLSWENIRREGWRTATVEIGRAFRHARDRVLDGWPENSCSRTERPT